MKALDCLKENMKLRRKALGFRSSRAFAESIDLAPITIAKIEAGQSFPAVDTITKIARGLKCSESDLFTDPNNKKVEKKKTKLSVENPGLGDVTQILEKLRDASPIHRSIVLAILFLDETLMLPSTPKPLRLVWSNFAKAQLRA